MPPSKPARAVYVSTVATTRIPMAMSDYGCIGGVVEEIAGTLT
jgi:hypothetical protein